VRAGHPQNLRTNSNATSRKWCDLRHSQNNAGSILTGVIEQQVAPQEKIMISNSATVSRPCFEAPGLVEVALYAVLVILTISIIEMFC